VELGATVLLNVGVGKFNCAEVGVCVCVVVCVCVDGLGLARFFRRRFVLFALMGTFPITFDLASLAKAYLPERECVCVCVCVESVRCACVCVYVECVWCE